MTAPHRDYYKVIGVAPAASLDDIKRAFRASSRKYHPDLNPENREEAERKMRVLVEADEILENPEQRKAYDNQPHFQLRSSKRVAHASIGKTKKRPQPEESIFGKFAKIFAAPQPAKAKKPNPAQANEHFLIGMSMAQNKNFYDQALKEFQQAAQSDLYFTEAHWNAGILSYKQGLFEQAVVYFQNVLDLSPGDANADKMIELLRDDF